VPKFYGQFDPPVDRVIFERYFPDIGIAGVFVECGAFDGLLESSCKFFEETMGWTGVNLEPAPVNYRALVGNRPLSKNLNMGLSAKAGRTTFTHVISPVRGASFGNGSILHTPEHRAALLAAGCTFEEVEIEVTTWKTLVESENLRHVDLFVLDVEGHELSVLEGMEGSAVLPDIMCVEVGHLDFGDVRASVESLGYTYDISSHVNAFFVKTEMLLLFAMRRASASAARVAHLEQELEAMRTSRSWRYTAPLRRNK
jgi:FkbM family methyltransferase